MSAFRDAVAAMDAVLVDNLGEPTSYTPAATGSPVSVRGIFDAAYVRVDVGQAGVSSAGPAVFYRLADLPVDPDDESQVGIAGVTYSVDDVQKDGQGGVRLILRRRT